MVWFDVLSPKNSSIIPHISTGDGFPPRDFMPTHSKPLCCQMAANVLGPADVFAGRVNRFYLGAQTIL